MFVFAICGEELKNFLDAITLPKIFLLITLEGIEKFPKWALIEAIFFNKMSNFLF